MALSSTTNKVREQGNGVKVAFDTTFPVQEAAHLEVYKVVRATDASTLQTITTNYTVAINTVTRIATVTYVVAPTALEDSLIVRTVPLTQGADIPTNNIFREVQIENALDKQMMALQQVSERIDRTVLLPIASTVSELELPIPETGSVLAWNSTADGLENKTIAELGALEKASQAEAEAGSNDTKYMTPLKTAQAIAAQVVAAAATELSFVNADLSTGVLTVTHNAGLSAGYTAVVTVVNNSGAVIIPDAINTFAANSFKVDLTSYGVISGTWFCTYIVKG